VWRRPSGFVRRIQRGCGQRCKGVSASGSSNHGGSAIETHSPEPQRLSRCHQVIPPPGAVNDILLQLIEGPSSRPFATPLNDVKKSTKGADRAQPCRRVGPRWRTLSAAARPHRLHRMPRSSPPPSRPHNTATTTTTTTQRPGHRATSTRHVHSRIPCRKTMAAPATKGRLLPAPTIHLPRQPRPPSCTHAVKTPRNLGDEQLASFVSKREACEQP
jgi:hypothetical protein